MKYLAALSGGVDSAVAAYIAKEMGHEIVGVHMSLIRYTQNSNEYCALDEANDAREIAKSLGIDFRIVDFSNEYRKNVVEYFINEYKNGRTPNPCVNCNKTMKLPLLASYAKKMGLDGIITGHYARIIDKRLYRGKNKQKDQSYVLSSMPLNLRKSLFFPLGDYSTKEEIRNIASNIGLDIADKKDSFDICFIYNTSMKRFLADKIREKKGRFFDLEGNDRGEHTGFYNFTIGQRRGIKAKNLSSDKRGISGHKYVIDIDKKNNKVILGAKQDLEAQSIRFSDVNWHDLEIFEGLEDNKKVELEVQIRAHGRHHKATVTNEGNDNYIAMLEVSEKSGVAKGQIIVGYKEDRVIFQGVII